MADPGEGLRAALADRYIIERELGRGGMATVYLAQDLKHDRPVALKVLHPELAASLGPERFLREIKLAARLQHPHILTVLDSGDAAGRLWFTMPFVEGESLRDQLRRGRQLPVEDAVRIAREAAQALQYAHDHGIVHRDIKPENLLLTRDGNTLVADFGIARGLQTGGESDQRLTDTGLVVGTPAYMSPEQAAGDRALDARSDLYSLGSVLYEMLAGEPPFTAPTMQAMIMKRLTEPPPSVRAARATVPEAVDQAIRKALAPLAADRFASAAELARALAPVTTQTTLPMQATAPAPSGTTTATSALPATRPAPARYRAVAVLGIGFLLGLGVLFAWRHGHPEAAPGDGTERRIAVLPFQNVGDSADAYFADGMTDAVRGKLTALPTMRVTGSNSSGQYRGTTKTPQEIGRDLGVDYLLAKRDLAAARSVLAQQPSDVDMPAFVAYMATYWDLYWVLDGDQRGLLKRLTPASFDGDAGSWGLALAGVYETEKDLRRAATYGDSARTAFEQQLYAAPDNAQLHALLGLALAYAGRKDAAVREGERAVAADSNQSQNAMYFRHLLARIHILNGEQEKALDLLEPLLKRPYFLSPGWLRIDPTFDPLRNNPRFKRLVEGSV